MVSPECVFYSVILIFLSKYFVTLATLIWFFLSVFSNGLQAYHSGQTLCDTGCIDKVSPQCVLSGVV